MALLSQRSVDKHIFEGSPKHKNNSKALICLSLAATKKRKKISGVTRTSSFIRTQTTHSTAAAPLRDREDDAEICCLSAPPCPLSEPAERTSCKPSSKQQHFTSLSPPPSGSADDDGPTSTVHIHTIRHVSAMCTYTTQKERSIQLLIRLLHSVFKNKHVVTK